MIKNIKFLKLKPILLIAVYFSLINFAYSHNHFPITIDSKIMIAKGKIAYENNCVSCHMINLADHSIEKVGSKLRDMMPGLERIN